MRMEALRQTNYVKSIVTAQGKMDLERKGKQSYQGWMFARLLAFSNGDLQALYAVSYTHLKIQGNLTPFAVAVCLVFVDCGGDFLFSFGLGFLFQADSMDCALGNQQF